MKVYKTSIGFKIFGLLFALPLIIVSTSILLVPFVPVPSNTVLEEMQHSWPPPGYLLYLIPICLVGINLLALIILIGIFRKNVVITDKEIIYTNVFITRKLEFHEVESFYLLFGNICLEPKKRNLKNLNINYIGLSEKIDLIKTLRAKLFYKS